MVKSQRRYSKNHLISTYTYPPSAHPPGLLPGIVHSTLFRIFTLCSDPDDQLLRTKVFFKRLQARCYKSNQIKPLFLKAIARAKLYSGPNDTTNNDHTTVIFHLPYHPNDPPSHQIQQAWRQTVASPKYHMPLPDMRNPKSKEKCNIQRMIIAYCRPMNIETSSHIATLTPTPRPHLSRPTTRTIRDGRGLCVCVCVCVCVCLVCVCV